MQLNEIRVAMRDAEAVPAAALAAAMAHAAVLAPDIVALLERAAAGTVLLLEEERLLRYGLPVLAAARRTEVFPALRALLAAPWQTRPRLFGPTPHAGEARLLTSLFDGNAEPLFALLDAPEIEVDVQCALFASLAWLAHAGVVAPERLLAALDRFEAGDPDKDDDGWIGWRDAVLALHLTDRAERRAARWGIEWPPASVEAEADPADPLLIGSAPGGSAPDGGAGDAGAVADPAAAGDESGPIDADWDAEDLDQDDWDELARREWLLRVLGPPEPDDLVTMAPIDDPAAACVTGEPGLPPAVSDALSDEEQDWLGHAMLEVAKAGRGQTLEATDGYLTACLVAGGAAELARHEDAIWDPGAAAATLGRPVVMAAVRDMLARHFRALGARFAAGEAIEPILQNIGVSREALLWMGGFMFAVARQGEVWDRLKQNRRIFALLDLMDNAVATGTEADRAEQAPDDAPAPDDPIDPALLERMMGGLLHDRIVERLPEIVAELHRRSRGPRLVATSRAGRNDPCPCGSGRKYKKCCGAAGAVAVS